MKKTLLRLTMVAALIGASTISYAQDSRFSIGVELGLPMGDFGDYSGFGIGGSLRYEIPVGDAMGFTATAGYISFGGKDVTVMGVTAKTESTGMIPIQLGLKYYFQDQQEGFYGHVMVGVHMFSVDETTVDPVTFQTTTESKMKTKFSFAPEVGYHLANLDFGLRYQFFSMETVDFDPVTYEVTEGTTMYNYLGIRAAYVLGGK